MANASMVHVKHRPQLLITDRPTVPRGTRPRPLPCLTGRMFHVKHSPELLAAHHPMFQVEQSPATAMPDCSCVSRETFPQARLGPRRPMFTGNSARVPRISNARVFHVKHPPNYSLQTFSSAGGGAPFALKGADFLPSAVPRGTRPGCWDVKLPGVPRETSPELLDVGRTMVPCPHRSAL
jgi:hypothetical protein